MENRKKDKEKMGKKGNKKLFYKTNPYGGISLIVLVITIIVVIILAAAVIISLQHNNPMSEANRARYESDVANMQMIFTNTVGKIMAEKQEVVGIKECQINQVTSGVKSTTGEVIYKINDEDAGKIIFTNEKSEEANNYITGKKLPIYSSQTKWNVDGDGLLRLQIGDKSYGEGKEVVGGTDTPSDLVTISKEEYSNLLEKVSKLDNIGQIYTKTNTINISTKGNWVEVPSATWTLPAGTWVIDFYFRDNYNYSPETQGIWTFYLPGMDIYDTYWKVNDADWSMTHFTCVKTFEKETTTGFNYYQRISSSPRNVEFTMYAVRIK